MQDELKIILTLMAAGCTSQQFIITSNSKGFNSFNFPTKTLTREFADVLVKVQVIDQFNQPLAGASGDLTCSSG